MSEVFETALAQVGAGFAQPVRGSQQVFRALLQAMARPGRVQRLHADAMAGLQPPAGFGPALCGVLLSLLDADTPVHLGAGLRSDAALRYFGFHCGTRAAEPERAAFAALTADEADEADGRWWARLRDGSDEAPQDGATLVVEVPSLAEAERSGTRLSLRGPGIRGLQHLCVGGLGDGFWRARIARQADFPRGIDLVLACGDRVAALPRTTQIALED